MSKERIKMLEQWIKEDPSDPFNKYGLALELQASNNIKADALFNELLEVHADYIPTYYTAANFYMDDNEPKAIQILEKGIELAKEQGNDKAKRELQSLLDQLSF